jgi:hypothetical protein
MIAKWFITAALAGGISPWLGDAGDVAAFVAKDEDDGCGGGGGVVRFMGAAAVVVVTPIASRNCVKGSKTSTGGGAGGRRRFRGDDARCCGLPRNIQFMMLCKQSVRAARLQCQHECSWKCLYARDSLRDDDDDDTPIAFSLYKNANVYHQSCPSIAESVLEVR